jgi:hypothetical protein
MGTVPNSNKKIVERVKINTHKTKIQYMDISIRHLRFFYSIFHIKPHLFKNIFESYL